MAPLSWPTNVRRTYRVVNDCWKDVIHHAGAFNTEGSNLKLPPGYRLADLLHAFEQEAVFRGLGIQVSDLELKNNIDRRAVATQFVTPNETASVIGAGVF